MGVLGLLVRFYERDSAHQAVHCGIFRVVTRGALEGGFADSGTSMPGVDRVLEGKSRKDGRVLDHRLQRKPGSPEDSQALGCPSSDPSNSLCL